MKGVVEVEGTVRSPGALGERIAADYLALVGCTIIERNFRSGHVEIDLVVQDGACVAFVEVKTRRCASFGEAIEAVRPDKVRHLRRAARAFLMSPPSTLHASEFRFDLVALDLDPGRGTMLLRHVKGIA
jgi:putative endonuclease